VHTCTCVVLEMTGERNLMMVSHDTELTCTAGLANSNISSHSTQFYCQNNSMIADSYCGTSTNTDSQQSGEKGNRRKRTVSRRIDGWLLFPNIRDPFLSPLHWRFHASLMIDAHLLPIALAYARTLGSFKNEPGLSPGWAQHEPRLIPAWAGLIRWAHSWAHSMPARRVCVNLALQPCSR